MGIDAVALLRIANLPAPATPYGNHPVEHRGDATLLHTLNRFDAADPDEHALTLCRLLGDALDAHDDPRGILIFADVCEPKGGSYDATVGELSARGDGAWAPKVDANYVPVRYRGTPRQPHDVLVGELIGAIGRDAALQLDMMAHVNKVMLVGTPNRRDAVEGYRVQLKAVAEAKGAEFASRYDASLQAEVDAAIAAQSRPPISLDMDVTDAVNEMIAPAAPEQGLLDEMIRVMGPDAASKQALMALDARIALSRSPDDPDAANRYRTEVEAIARAMGAEFARRYETSLKAKANALIAEVAPVLKDWVPPPGWLKPD